MPHQVNKQEIAQYYALAKQFLKGECKDDSCREAVALLVQYHHRLIAKAIRTYVSPAIYAQPQVWDDLYHECVIALIEALREYEPERGTQFSTFVFPRLRYALQTAVRLTSDLMLSNPYSRRLYIRAEQLSWQATIQHGKALTVSEIAQYLKVNTRTLRKAMTLSSALLRLETKHPESENETRERPVRANQDAFDFLDEAMLHRFFNVLEEALATMPEDNAKVLRLYLGMDDGKSLGVYQIAEAMQISRNQAKRLLEEAIAHVQVTGAEFWEQVKERLEIFQSYAHNQDSYPQT
ncbi:MAG: sigma-70 family RNA polymerase sigma factor [Candidatus Methanomethylicaceae archaeon]